jgi:SAM-dependent methyltransferase
MIPWWLKIIAKVGLSRLRLPYRVYALAGMFRHGHMDDALYAHTVFARHMSYLNTAQDWSGLELGPGDTVFSAVLAKSRGVANYWLVDVGSFAHSSPEFYKRMLNDLRTREILGQMPDIDAAKDLSELLLACNSQYLVDGVRSLGAVPSSSVDILWSQAVLEHIRVAEFEVLCEEMFRVLKPGARASHHVDFKDHLSASLNNLRFSSQVWEREWFAARSGFYTNRIRPRRMTEIFERCGFLVEAKSISRWPVAPIRREALAPEFKQVPDDDLLVSGIHFVLQKPESSSDGRPATNFAAEKAGQCAAS